ncbi:MAG TPA: hypothetical protein VFG74_05280, partial [Miltoncostaeaceae bacterium]|nr:hypothetical protein [Miltoncostaeaceae bacterium]
MHPRSVALWLNLAVKAALVALLLVGAFSGLQQFEGKAFGGRLLTYPIAALVVPAGWALAGRRPPYPYAADILLTLPFLIDVAGNALDLYDTVDWWDDANHFVNWTLLAAGFGALVARAALPRWSVALLVVGFGAASAIVWELAEYVAFIRNSPELQTAYTDTLGDLAFGLAGSVLAAVLVITLPFRLR